jgi:hypothetical protein
MQLCLAMHMRSSQTYILFTVACFVKHAAAMQHMATFKAHCCRHGHQDVQGVLFQKTIFEADENSTVPSPLVKVY